MLPVAIGVLFSLYVAIQVVGVRRNGYSKIHSNTSVSKTYIVVSIVLLAILFALFPKGHDGELTSEDIYRMLLFSLLTCASPGIVLLAGKLIGQKSYREDE